MIRLPAFILVGCVVCAGLIPIEFGSVSRHRPLPEARLPSAEVEPAAPEIRKLAKETPSSANDADSPLRDVRLTGVVIGPGLRMAIFAVTGTNSRVLSEGETLNGWRLESISPKVVMLSGPEGNIVLKPQSDANLVRPPPPVAVQPGQPDPPMAGAAGQPMAVTPITVVNLSGGTPVQTQGYPYYSPEYYSGYDPYYASGWDWGNPGGWGWGNPWGWGWPVGVLADSADAGTAGSAAAFSVQTSDASALVTLASSIRGSDAPALCMRVLVAVSVTAWAGVSTAAAGTANPPMSDIPRVVFPDYKRTLPVAMTQKGKRPSTGARGFFRHSRGTRRGLPNPKGGAAQAIGLRDHDRHRTPGRAVQGGDHAIVVRSTRCWSGSGFETSVPEVGRSFDETRTVSGR